MDKRDAFYGTLILAVIFFLTVQLVSQTMADTDRALACIAAGREGFDGVCR